MATTEKLLDELTLNEDDASTEQHLESICWNCKKALSAPDCYCSWSKRLRPVKGWKAIPGAKLANTEERGKIVLECPEFEQWYEYTCWKEVYEELSKHFKKNPFTLRRNIYYWLQKYQKEIGKEVPRWALTQAKQAAEEAAEEAKKKAEERKTHCEDR